MSDDYFDFLCNTLVELQNCVSRLEHNLNILKTELSIISMKLATRKDLLLKTDPDPPTKKYFL